MNYRTKKEEMEKKYKVAIQAIAIANNVDLGVAFDMLESNVNRGATYAYVNVEEYKKDYQELIELAKKN